MQSQVVMANVFLFVYCSMIFYPVICGLYHDIFESHVKSVRKAFLLSLFNVNVIKA